MLVWKEIDYGSMHEEEKKHIVSEVNILRDLKHPNIVKYYDRIIDKKNTKIYIVMEYCEGGDIMTMIRKFKKNGDRIKEEVIWKILSQLCLAVNECHNRKEKILHRDLKASNVFLDGEGNIKLGDFGLSRILGEQSVFAYSHVGTPYYMSPEQIEEQNYDEKSDIWSLGCLIYELTTLNPPFEATNQLKLAEKIRNDAVKPIPSRYSEDLMNVINWMLCKSQRDRPSISELLQHPLIGNKVKEKKLSENVGKLEKLEAALQKKEKELLRKEGEVKKKEKEINEKFAELMKERIMIDTKSMELEKKEKELVAREKEVSKRELDLKLKIKEHQATLSTRNVVAAKKESYEYLRSSEKVSTSINSRKNSSHSRKNSTSSTGNSLVKSDKKKEKAETKFTGVTPDYLNNLESFLNESNKYLKGNKTAQNKTSFDPSVYGKNRDWLDNYGTYTNLSKVNERFKRIGSKERLTTDNTYFTTRQRSTEKIRTDSGSRKKVSETRNIK